MNLAILIIITGLLIILVTALVGLFGEIIKKKRIEEIAFLGCCAGAFLLIMGISLMCING